ncbi:putative zinc-binding alcohol dehydrogenase [subsurface metagenome]
MNALTFQGKKKIVYQTVPDPFVETPTDVIIKVHYTAVCGSDMHVYHEREKGIDKGTIMGHEFVGEIIELGKQVKSFHIGDKVISPFTTNCGNCYFCSIGLTARCMNGQLFGWVEKGKGLQGAQAEYVRVPYAESTLVNYPENIPTQEALLFGDIFPTGFFCADMAEIKSEGIYVVLGCGPVGLMAIIGAKLLGAVQIYAIDSIENRLSFARKYGAIPVHLYDENPVYKILEVTNSIGADAVLEAVGNNSAGKLAFQLVRPGGIISTVGVHTKNEFPFSPVDAYNKNITFKIGRCPARNYIERLITFAAKKRLELDKIITHQYPLKEGAKAYKLFDKKDDGCIKVILKP